MSLVGSRNALLEVVERIQPIIEEHAPQAEAERRLTDEVYRAMYDGGLFAMLAPQKYGGLELPLVDAMAVWEAVARIDSAAAWNLVMIQQIAGFAAYLPPEGAQELFADGPTTVAGALFPPGAARRDDGGWRITGKVPFASGCHHASWCALPAIVMDGDQPKIDPGTGQPTMIGSFLPRRDVEILDTWHTVGMRGTGSADISVHDRFVPDHRTFVVGPLTHPAPGFEGPLYRMLPWPGIVGEATVSVGVAAAAVAEVTELVRTKTPAYLTTPLREQQLAQYFVGRAHALVAAARDTLHRGAEQIYDQVERESSLSWESKIRIQLAVSFVADACREAVRLVTDVAGTSAIRLEQRFERYSRDIQVLAQHSDKSSPRYATAGRLLFGLENDWVWLSF
jgi:indole-3-acetate monooxygenase